MLYEVITVPGDALEFKYQPTGPEPINVKNAVLGDVTSSSPPFLSQTTACAQPSGSPASFKISTNLIADIGVWVAGLIITGQPTAIAGITWWIAKLKGWLNAEIAATTPIGFV